MAYSLNDVYRPLRAIMRLNGFVIGLGLGILFLVFPRTLLADWGVYTSGPVWLGRLAGALLVTLGIMFVLAAYERVVNSLSMVIMVIANSLIAVVVLLAYLQHELAALTVIGQIVLVVIFLICLVSAVFPLRYLRADYQM